MKLQKFITQYKGSSFPVLIETDSLENYVLKMRGAGNGPMSLIAEFIANRIASCIGWQVPDVRWIEIPHNFPWTFGTDEFDDIVQKSYGWNLGIVPITDAVQIKPQDLAILSHTFFEQLFSLDLFFVNVERTAAACNILKDKYSNPWIIDHGSLGLFQNIRVTSDHLFPNHILYSLPELSTVSYNPGLHRMDIFEKTIREIPRDILDDAHISQSELSSVLEKRIYLLQDHH